MPVTLLDIKTALVLIDLQKGIVSMPGIAHPIGPVVANSVALAEAFRARSLPVVLVHVKPGTPLRTEQPRPGGELPPEFFEFIPELNQQPTDHVVLKHNWGAFTNTALADYLHAQGVTQIVLAGVATSVGVESSARQANELGFNVTLATDAMTDRSLEAHTNSLTRVFPRLGETGTTAEILALLP